MLISYFKLRMSHKLNSCTLVTFMPNTLYRLCIQFVTRPAIVCLIAAMAVKYTYVLKNK